MEETQKITMKDVNIDMKVENNEMKSAHLEISRILTADFRSFPIIYQIHSKRLHGFCIYASFYSESSAMHDRTCPVFDLK